MNEPPRRRSFSKEERLCSRRAFEYLFEHGFSFREGVLKCFYTFKVPPEWVKSPVSIAFAVPKHMFRRAHDRHRLRRRMREAFRLNKEMLLPTVESRQQHLVFLLKYQVRDESDYLRIEKDLKGVLGRLERFARKELSAEAAGTDSSLN